MCGGGYQDISQKLTIHRLPSKRIKMSLPSHCVGFQKEIHRLPGLFETIQGTWDVILIVVGNGHIESSLNPGRGCLHFI